MYGSRRVSGTVPCGDFSPLPHPPPPLFLVISSAKDCHSYLIVLGMATSMCPQKNSECLLRVLMHDALLEEFFAVFQKSCGALPLVDVS